MVWWCKIEVLTKVLQTIRSWTTSIALYRFSTRSLMLIYWSVISGRFPLIFRWHSSEFTFRVNFMDAVSGLWSDPYSMSDLETTLHVMMLAILFSFHIIHSENSRSPNISHVCENTVLVIVSIQLPNCKRRSSIYYFNCWNLPKFFLTRKLEDN